MMNVLFSFIGGSDLKRIIGQNDTKHINGDTKQLGPIGTILDQKGHLFDEVWLLVDKMMYDKIGHYDKNKIVPFYEAYFHKPITLVPLLKLAIPADHKQIFDEVEAVFLDFEQRNAKKQPKFFFNLSSGTSSMHSILLLLGKSRYNAVMYQSHEKDGRELVEEVNVPFPITLETISKEIQTETSLIREVLHHKADESGIIGNHPKMLMAKDNTAQYALCDFNTLITGESGTGKELFARYYQDCNLLRKGNAFISENCANFPESLIESELFGHAKGAFTGANFDKKGSFQLADGGVLFLDEVGEMPESLQAKLLRVLETGEIRPVGSEKTRKVDVRIIAATNSPEKLRLDLLYRLADGVLHLPPLRERGNDILLIAEYMLATINDDLAKKLRGSAPYYAKSFDPSAIKLLLSYSWPGNVRELTSVIKRACALEKSESIHTSQILQKELLGKLRGP
jgi:transcriptional regulator with PAS, ATPase and Fis domain